MHHQPWSISLRAVIATAAVFCPLAHGHSTARRGFIHKDPAPSPEEGPPLSRGASRDPALLPAQIGSIAGSYVLCILIIGTALFFVGRRLRRDAQTSSVFLDVEMVKPTIPKSIDTTPISPKSNGTIPWPSPKKGGLLSWSPTRKLSNGAPNFSYPSPSKQSFVTFDERVIEEDKASRERDMERLYAAVMEQDAATASRKNSPVESSYPTSPGPMSPGPMSSGPMSPGPTSPGPTSPGKHQGFQLSLPLSNRSTMTSQAASENPRSPTATVHSRHSSLASVSSKRRGIRRLPISSPIPTPTFSLHSRAASDEKPLTPSLPPPAPPLSPPLGSHPTGGHLRSPLSPPPTQRQSSVSKPLPLRSHPSYNSSASNTNGPLSPPPTKLTVLERKPQHSSQRKAGFLSATTPMTAGQVPYSPYMPFTPITPITPRLVTREERKRKQKEEGREMVTEMVEDEKGMWDEGY
ncbi:MAG: hypothetical protein M1837_006294 [Sclerophora amabilis]|nr:MAG: hypothetical protein M1837_006294 [Sclerophora amabilis]